jgi:protein-tyrosine phosphatase
MGFTDIHSHILYGVDDGAKTLEESLGMLQLAAASGTTDIVATPHVNGQFEFDPELIDERIDELSARSAVRIHRGCDFHLEAENIEDAIANPDKYTINNRGYLLVEFPDLSIFTSTDEILSDLVGAGMMPIITHPERNGRLQQRLDDIARWVELGCLVQVTAGSVTGRFGKRAKTCVDQLMERGLVHFVASDAHDLQHRPPSLRQAHAAMTRKWGAERVEPLFVDNPRAALTGEAIDVDYVPQLGKRKWFQLW